MDMGLYFRHPITIRGCCWSAPEAVGSQNQENMKTGFLGFPYHLVVDHQINET